MKVLVTGGYGFIGSHVVDRFYKEGYEIVILDNLSTGSKENVSCKHRGYIIDVTDPKCEELFRAHRFDVVVHLAAQVSVQQSLVNPTLDTQSNIAGLVNMLNLSVTYNVKRFIYASSAAIYGLNEAIPLLESYEPDPISPYGMSKLANEFYAKKWNEMHGLSTIGFRLSNVYGPRQNHQGEGGVISIFINKMLNGQELKVYGSGEQTRDFIYVEDVSDAIYRSALSSITGVYNLSTNRSTSINEIIENLKGYSPDVKVQYEEARSNDILHSCLSNVEIMKKLDWSPMYDIAEGLRKTYSDFYEKKATSEVAATNEVIRQRFNVNKEKIKQNKWILPTIENLFAFILTAWLTLNLNTNIHAVVDVKLFYITIISILYGNRQSLVAVVLSVGLLTYEQLQIGRDLISLTYDTNYFFPIAIYLFAGLVVGYTVQRLKNQISQREQQNKELTDKYHFLEEIYTEVREVKEEMQLRILNSNDSYGKIYNATKELESLEPEVVFNSAVNVIKRILNVPKVSIYRVNSYQSFLRLLASTGYHGNELQKSIRITDYPYLKNIIETGEMFTNKQLIKDTPLMTAPIFYNKKVAAIVAIDGISFEKFTLYYQNLFHITVNLIESALGRAFSFIEATEGTRYIKNTQILHNEVFQGIIHSKNFVRKEHKVPYLLINAHLKGISFEHASDHIAPLLRETDYIGLNELDQIQILLSNTSEDDFVSIKNRLHHAEIDYTLQAEE